MSNIILPDLSLSSRRNAVLQENGIDSYRKCRDRTHFKNFKHNVSYNYNSRGFRDDEWPEDLTNAIWCFGDSFTVGIGSPIDHTWVNVLQEKTGRRCINISMDGASNKWIARKAQQVINEIKPTNIVIQWSFLSRDENSDCTLSDEQRRIHIGTKLIDDVDQIAAFIKIFNTHVTPVNILHSFIPAVAVSLDLTESWNNIKDESWPKVPEQLSDLYKLPKYIQDELKNKFNVYTFFKYLLILKDHLRNRNSTYINIEQIDFARDGYHYDIKTATAFIDSIIESRII